MLLSKSINTFLEPESFWAGLQSVCTIRSGYFKLETIVMDTNEKLLSLIGLHLDDLDKNDRSWCILDSPLGGRGLFAVRDIEVGEVIFRERPLLFGPSAQRKQLHNCVVCCKALDENSSACKRGCSLPACDICSSSNDHMHECELYKSWEPIDPFSVNRQSVQILPVVRGLFLQKHQKDLIYCLQANNFAKCKLEIAAAAKCFKNFPSDKETFSYFCRILAVINTVAFEAVHQEEMRDIAIRGLYPLAGLLNHECTPNTCHPFEKNNIVVVKAARFISKGSEITTTYTKLLWSNISRRLFLNLTKEFTCACARCRDPTENGTHLSGLLCRQDTCQGIVIPEHTLTTDSPWKCLSCQKIYKSKEMHKFQDFTLAVINSKANSNSVKEIISFIKEKVPKFCPPNNQYVVEAKLNVIWKMSKCSEDFTEEDFRDKIKYCEDILEVLNKLNAGECTTKELIQEEMRTTKDFLEKVKLNK